MNDWTLTETALDHFLTWLDPDREQAAKKYEAVRRRLIVFFNCRGCAAAEDLTDETIDRVTRQAPSLAKTYIGEPIRYFYGVAHNVHREYLKKQARKDGGPLNEATPARGFAGENEEKERASKCLSHCLQKLTPHKRQIFTQYYLVEMRQKVGYREKLAEEFNYSLPALRLQIHRLRGDVRKCIVDCMTS